METAHPLLGKTLAGRFRVTRVLGEGAMATVLRGEQDAEPREVAIKVMRPELGIDPTFPKRFRREAKAASLLDHPNTVKIFDFGADGDTHYIVMELLRGRDLFELLVAEKRFSEARAARILMQICEALAVAHGQGIIHRDLKPENVWIEPDAKRPGVEHVKVLDFGIAKLLESDLPDSQRDGAPSSMLTGVGAIVGTPEYMSPEQCRAEPVSPRSDVYACGVLLYALLCGRPPFMAEAALDVTLKHVHDVPEPPSHLRPGLHVGLEAIILKALAKAPDDRQKSAIEFRDALAAILPTLSNKPAVVPGPIVPPFAKTAVSPSASDPQPPPKKPSPLERTLASEGGAAAPAAPAELPLPPVVQARPQEPAFTPNPRRALAKTVNDIAPATQRPQRKGSRNVMLWIVGATICILAAVAIVAIRLHRL